MTGILIPIHVIICILLVIVILMQSGRGGGLTEGFAAAESMFGAKTNSFMIKTTTVLASVFLITCLSLAYFSSDKDRSLMEKNGLVQKELNQPLDETKEDSVSGNISAGDIAEEDDLDYDDEVEGQKAILNSIGDTK